MVVVEDEVARAMGGGQVGVVQELVAICAMQEAGTGMRRRLWKGVLDRFCVDVDDQNS